MQTLKGRGTKNEFVRFLNSSYGSLTELDTHFVIAKEQRYIDATTFSEVVGLIEQVGRIPTGPRKSLVK